MASAVEPGRLSPDFRRFWIGQSISNLGNSVTTFAAPLLIYKLTGSALNLGLASAFQMLPYLLFGLIIGAWVDRVDRKRLMIFADIGRAAIMATIPLLALADSLPVWWVYERGFSTRRFRSRSILPSSPRFPA